MKKKFINIYIMNTTIDINSDLANMINNTLTNLFNST